MELHKNQLESDSRNRHIAGTFAFGLLSLAISGVYAAIECRGLYQDGAYYLYRIAEREGFYLFDPARTTVQVMRQAPVVLLTKLGNFSLVERAEVFSLAMLLIPVLLCGLCWIIVPAGRKVAALFPILFLLIGFSATSFNAVGEASIAASWFWLLPPGIFPPRPCSCSSAFRRGICTRARSC
jgi:hypothetical protein